VPLTSPGHEVIIAGAMFLRVFYNQLPGEPGAKATRKRPLGAAKCQLKGKILEFGEAAPEADDCPFEKNQGSNPFNLNSFKEADRGKRMVLYLRWVGTLKDEVSGWSPPFYVIIP